MHSVGSRLKVWREAASLKQVEAADKLGLSASTYQNYERDVRAPNTEGWEAFVRAGINANWLLTGEGPMLLADLQTASRPAEAIDTETLTYVIEEIERVLKARRLELRPEKKAALIQLLYDYCADTGRQEPGTIERFLKLVA